MYINFYTPFGRFQKLEKTVRIIGTQAPAALCKGIFEKEEQKGMERLCRECAAPLAGRSDKQFCCDACRTAFHNRRYREQWHETAGINRILRVNRLILASLSAAGVRDISLSDNRLKGFDCRYCTEVKRYPLRRTAYRCYEFGYLIAGGRICRITRYSEGAI